ncbi:MAG: hypothetical protein R3B09_33725 [Nannocystaceae bacterium]
MSVDDHTGGRRGGGGAILLEILPADGAEGLAVGDLALHYRDALTDQPVDQMIHVDAPVAPDAAAPFFADPSVEKGFVMMNIYMGFQMASMRAQSGDLAAPEPLLGLADTV